MEPVTHFLTGACLGRAGFNRKTAYATLAAVLAAEAADLDILWGFAGPVDELKHHRGITHTFIAVPVVAGVVVGAVWLFDRWRRNRAKRPAQIGDTPSSPTNSATQSLSPLVPAGAPGGRSLPAGVAQSLQVNWGWLYLTACIAALSHILLDWTNNYGVRPFFPFNARWYAGSFMFIAEPILWGLFLLAFAMPWLLGLADSEIGARRKSFRGQGWAIFALTGMLLLGGLRWAEHGQALSIIDGSNITSEPITRKAAEPYPVNPFHWHGIIETADFYQTAEINSWSGSVDSDPQRDVLYKPADTPAIEAAKRTPLGQVYLDWGAWAVVQDLGQGPAPGMDPPQLAPNRVWTTVEFSDLRFHYQFTGANSAAARSTLSGWVYIVDGRDDAGESMDGHEQH